MRKTITILASCCLLLLTQQKQLFAAEPPHVRKLSMQVLYDSFAVEGCLVILDETENTLYLNDSQGCSQAYSPASTFKIANTLIALETGIAPDAELTLAWDSIIRPIPAWNRNHNLQSAYRYSVVWYYQELARRIGKERMKFWLDSLHYGNNDTGGGIDGFWLDGALRISPMQQIDFLSRLQHQQLGMSERSYRICRRVMLADSNAHYTLWAKTGWGSGIKDHGWYVGIFNVGGKVYYFAHCIWPKEETRSDFAEARKAIVMQSFRKLGLIPED